MLLYFLVTMTAFVCMEFIAWFTHKYVMHGILWNWHADHHSPKHAKKGFFEKNDLFFLVFALPSMFCYMYGSMFKTWWLFFVGVGISMYGLVYFLVHDVYIHQRFKWFRLLDNFYSRAILRAHGKHHAVQSKYDTESFGLLVINKKFYKKKN